MSDRGRILVVAATDRELLAGTGWLTLRCGVGPVEAAAATAAAIVRHRPSAILHVGIAGARRAAGLVPPALVIGLEARYCDLGVSDEWAPSLVAASPVLVAAARRALPGAVAVTIGTSARVGGSTVSSTVAGTLTSAVASAVTSSVVCDVEAMEGFAVLRAAQLAGIPAIEIRAISNEIEERDLGRWRFDEAFAAVTAATPLVVAEFEQCVSLFPCEP